MEILGWIMGALIFLIGIIGYVFCWLMQPLHEAEVETMKKPGEGKYEGEPSYMKDFRESESEMDVLDNINLKALFRKIVFVGGAILIIMVAFHFKIIVF